MPAEHYEFAIVGGGKAGKTLAMQMASAGRRVVMIERGMIGGSCINIACIPSKALVRCAEIAELTRRAAQFGIRVRSEGAEPEGVRRRKREVVALMVKRNQEAFDRSGMTLVIGSARFTGPRAIEARLNNGEVRTFTADKVFINTGTRPGSLNLPGLADATPLNSESVQELDRLPEHLVILGGGYIGCEFAQIFRRFGSRVTIIDHAERFLSHEDADIAEKLLAVFQEEGIEVIHNASVERVEGISGRGVKIFTRIAKEERVIEGSDVLVAVGHIPNTEELNLSAAVVETDSRGFVKVNERLETTATGVWALGDVNGGPQFTHVSFDDYRIVTTNLAGGNRTTTDRLIPYTLFTDPELGRVGLTEAEARKKGYRVKIARLATTLVPRAVTAGELRGMFKAVIDADTDRILGAAILASEGGEVIATIQTAMLAKLPYTTLRDAIFSHPTMAEGLNELFAHVE